MDGIVIAVLAIVGLVWLVVRFNAANEMIDNAPRREQPAVGYCAECHAPPNDKHGAACTYAGLDTVGY
jgi:cytochrome c553